MADPARFPPPPLQLFTDAGIAKGIATWACVLVADDVAIFEHAGQFRADITDSTEAELKAVANGLHRCIVAGLVKTGDRVRVITDNARAAGIIRGPRKIYMRQANGRPINGKSRKARVRHQEAWDAIMRLADRHGLSMMADGVKGHQGPTSTDPKAKHNNRCDELCRIARGEVRMPRVQVAHGEGTSKAARARRRKREAAECPDRAELLLASHPCDQCLTSRNRIVSGERAAEIIRGCLRDGVHFQCHKGSIAGINLHCRGVHDRIGSTAAQLATRLGITIREIDPDTLS